MDKRPNFSPVRRLPSRRDTLASGPRASRPIVVLTNVSSDSHTWNLVFIQLVLEALGLQVGNLGACTPDDEILAVCREVRPDLLVVSSVNGHGAMDGERAGVIGLGLGFHDIVAALTTGRGGRYVESGGERRSYRCPSPATRCWKTCCDAD